MRSRVTATLREYLTCEYAAKRTESAPEKIFDKDLMPGHNAKVPQQNNFTDCGLFVLQYVEEMIRNPIGDFKLPIKALKSWFGIQKVTRKREDIAMLIKRLLEKEHADRVALLPQIDFPTVNGEPVEPEPPETQLMSATKPSPPSPTAEKANDGEDSEDLFDDIGDVMEEQEQEQQEEETDVVKAPLAQEKKKKLISFPSLVKRKSTNYADESGASSTTGSENSARKTARIS